MPRSSIKKTDDIEKKEKIAMKKSTTSKKATSSKSEIVKKTANRKSTSTKKTASTKSASAKKSPVVKKATVKKKTAVKETTVKKEATKKDTIVKKVATKKPVAKDTKKNSTKITAAKTTKKTNTKKTDAKATRKSTTVKKATKKKTSIEKNILDIVEYYDLPYRYNETVVKVLAQNPNTLFVYWDISDSELENFKKEYGDNFLYITKPVLVVHNLTNNYSFEIDINDFANNWYVHVDDTKCKYIVELGRRPIENNSQEHITYNFVKILSSNKIEIPNDHVLFYKNSQKLHFKNVKTNDITEKIIDKKQTKHLAGIYKYYSLEDDFKNNKFDFANPSSNATTSNVM